MVENFYSTCIWKMKKVNRCSKGISLGNILKIFLWKKKFDFFTTFIFIFPIKLISIFFKIVH